MGYAEGIRHTCRWPRFPSPVDCPAGSCDSFDGRFWKTIGRNTATYICGQNWLYMYTTHLSLHVCTLQTTGHWKGCRWPVYSAVVWETTKQGLSCVLANIIDSHACIEVLTNTARKWEALARPATPIVTVRWDATSFRLTSHFTFEEMTNHKWVFKYKRGMTETLWRGTSAAQ